MPVTLSAALKIALVAEQISTLDLASSRGQVNLNLSQVFDNGAGLNQANRMWHDRRTLNASANEDLDLAAVLVDEFGNTLTFTKVKAIIVKASVDNSNNVHVARPASNGVPWALAAGDGLALVPGGLFVFVAPSANGIAVTAGTGDLINIANSGGGTSVTYDVILIGTV